MALSPLHRALAVTLAGMLAPLQAACAGCAPAAPTALVERFVPADCERCWAAAPEGPPPPGALVLDWIAPAGEDAPLGAAALAEATPRAGRQPPGRTLVRRAALDAKAPVRLQVDHGPAWHGYIALRLLATRQGDWTGGAQAHVALVERVAAGEQGTAVERRLVRSVVGPLALDELASARTTEHLRALAIPEGSRPERLSGVAWIEAADGRVLAAAASPAGDCP